jgi:oligopeptide/dipeptide ABC transporter ATP-binding protein
VIVATSAPTAAPLLQVRHLRTHFFTDAGVVRSVEDVSFALNTAETLAVVGESGSGKSVTSLSIMGLIPNPPGRIVGGEILFRTREGPVVDLAKLPVKALRKLRGRDIAMIFQEPMTSLDPVFTVGDQIAETVALHLGLNRAEAMKRALEMLELVEIPAAKQRINEYPHQLSGGMRQRVMIALALSCNPSLLIADEPTTALDVTIQAQILALLDKLRRDIGMGVLFITHNLSVVAEIADRVVVMYSGRVVEEGDVHSLFKRPRHPYTRGLLECLPRRALDEKSDEKSDETSGETSEGASAMTGKRRRLNAIPGQVASPLDPLPGCAFAPRCALVLPECSAAMPPLAEVPAGQRSRCIRWGML